MLETADILFGLSGQSLSLDCPEGRPSSVTSVTVYEYSANDDGQTRSATTGSASVETNPNTTFDAASGVSQADPLKANLTATTGIAVGRRYLATAASGEREWVEVKYIASADYILARDPMVNDFAASDTFQSTRISISLDTTWVSDKNNISNQVDPNPRYRVRWVYVVAGVTCVQASYFDLVRYRGQYQVTGLDVDRAFPGWLNALPTYHREDQGAALITEAYRQVKMDLYRQEKADQLIRNAEIVNQLVLYKANALVATASVTTRNANPDVADYARRLYGDELQTLITWPKVAMDEAGQGGSTQKAAAAPLWRR